MTAQEFEKHQIALSVKLLEKDKNLAQESSRLWSHVSSRYYYFDQHLQDAARVISKVAESRRDEGLT